MLKLVLSNRFKKDMKTLKKRGYDFGLMETVVDTLMAQKPLDKKYRDHELSGNYAGFRECHILPDWLLVYKVEEDELLLFLFRTGTHSDLF